MNDPYPTAARLRAEAATDRILAEQDAATQAFHAAVIKCAAAIAPLYWPLGSPCTGFDIIEIEGALEDWLKPRDPRQLEDAAWDAAFAMTDAPA